MHTLGDNRRHQYTDSDRLVSQGKTIGTEYPVLLGDRVGLRFEGFLLKTPRQTELRRERR